MGKLYFSLFLISCVLLCSDALSETYVSGYQWGEWTVDKSPYVLTGDVTVVESEPYHDANENGKWDPGEEWVELVKDAVWTEDMPPLTIEPGVVYE